MASSMDRRKFLKVLGVTSGGAAAASGCGPDGVEKLIPYLVPPDDQIPGLPTFYASTCRECPAGCGLHVKVREGRAVKVEGNPDSPINRGRLCARGQASLQGLYNPDRLRGPMARNPGGGFDPISWDDALTRVVQQLTAAGSGQIRFISGNESGTFARLIGEWLAALGSRGGHVVYEPFGYEAMRQANRQVFGVDAIPHYDFAQADYVLSFGADFMETWVSPVQYAGDFTQRHAFADGTMGRYVHIDPRMSMTAFSADEWIAPNPGTEAELALAIAAEVLANHGDRAPTDASAVRTTLEAVDVDAVADRVGVAANIIRRLAEEFVAGPSLAVAGGVGGQHAASHATAAAVNILNYVAGNVGTTVHFGANVNPAGGSTYQNLTDLVSTMQGGGVAVLLVHGANPAFATPSGLGFADAMGQVGLKVSFSSYLDETSTLCDLILPDHTPLEQWNDFVPRDGVRTLQQPIMSPVFDTRQTGDVLLQLAAQVGGAVATGFPQATYLDYLRGAWADVQQEVADRGAFDDFWANSLAAGGVFGPAEAETVRMVSTARNVAADLPSPAADGLTLIAYPSAAFFDGRGANRPWLQELPDPVSKITWSTWLEIHPDTAESLDLRDGDLVDVTTPQGSVTVPTFRYPGLQPNVVAMPIGQGHTAYGRYAADRGASAYTLLPSDPAPFGGVSFQSSVALRKTGGYEKLATTAGVTRQLGRGIAQSTTADEVTSGDFHPFHVEHAAEVPEHIEEVLDEWQERQHEETEQGNYAGPHPRWALSVDLSRCTGCSACVTACYAENNIAIVGKQEVQRGREMTWIRIERFFEGGGDEPLRVDVLPMMCQQCGRAPCEPVCPVFAAYHTPDGLNGQIYNRCVGTRYCANNCPYKVRYFNWFDHGNPGDPAYSWPDPLPMQLNPDIVVRSKGVMEKCTFCVQRIRGVQHQAALENRSIRDGEIQTACQQTCPANAIVFGDLTDASTEVSRRSASELAYHVLESVNTAPAVAYLTRVRNTGEA